VATEITTEATLHHCAMVELKGLAILAVYF
jgi:hypothetical protein